MANKKVELSEETKRAVAEGNKIREQLTAKKTDKEKSSSTTSSTTVAQ